MDLAKSVFEFTAKRNIQPKMEQMEAIAELAEGRDVFVIAATGFGKSLVAQSITALRGQLGWGLTVCVNPLIALSADQHREAEGFGLRSDIWNSTRSEKQKAALIAKIEADEIDILFTTPESLRSAELRTALLGKVGLAWIDEGHSAISEKDFRHAWGRVGGIIDKIKPVARYACTATLESRKEDEAIRRCGLRTPHIIRLSADRNFDFRHIERHVVSVKDVIHAYPDQKILIYSATVRTCLTLKSELELSGVVVEAYNGQLPKKERTRIQNAFTQGEVKIVVCTDSFALGVNIPDIRAVVCYDPAKDISAFVQQAGRAGRDGLLSTIYLCSQNCSEGWRSREFLIKSGFPELSAMELVWNYLSSAGPEGVKDSQQSIAQAAGVEHWKFGAASIFGQLKGHGLVAEKHEGREFTWYARGIFGAVNWMDYLMQKPRALDGLRELKELWQKPEGDIRTEIVNLFAAEDKQAS